MKVKIKVEKEVEIKTLQVEAEVRYWEDSEVNGVEDTEDGENIPCKKGSLWTPLIDINTGIILNWEKGKTAKIHYKVCDAGSYFLQDKEGKNVLSIVNFYVPKILCPSGDGYGDYIIMNIDENGQIEDYEQDISDFENE